MRASIRRMPRTAWVIFVGTFVIKFGNFVSVFLVLYLNARGFSIPLAGLALAVLGAGNFVGNILGGLLADRVGKRSTLVVSMVGSGLVTAAIPFFTSYAAILAIVGLLGIMSQLFRPAAGSLLIEVVRPEDRLTAFTLLRLAINVGMSVGPAVGGLLSSFSYTWLFVGDGLTSLLYGVLALVLIPRDIPRARPARTKETGDGGMGYGLVLRDRRFLAYMFAMAAATFVYVQSTAVLPLHVTAVGLTNEQFGLLLGLNALLVVVLELPVVRVSGRYRTIPVIMAGMLVLGLGMAATGIATTFVALAVTVVVWTFGEMIYTPVANAYPAEVAPEHARGRYQGAEGIAHTIGATLGPLIGAVVYSVSPSLAWILFLVVAVVGGAAMLFARPVGAVSAESVTAAVEEHETPDRPSA